MTKEMETELIDNKRRAAVMTWEDQFEIADFLLYVLEEEGVVLTEEQKDVFIVNTLGITDDYSIGDVIITEQV